MVVLWRIATRCNFACAFCGFSRELERPRPETSAGEIRRVVALLAELRRRTGRRVLLSWLGGEPFLRRDLARLTRFAVRSGLDVSTTTNGSVLSSSSIRRHIVESYAELTLSLDGRADFHDAVRGAPGSFARVESGVRALVAERRRGKPLIRIQSVLMRDNVRDFPALARLIATWGVDEISVNELGGVERPEFHARERLSPRDAEFLQAELPPLRAELSKQNVRLLGSAEYLARIRASALGLPLPVGDCAPGDDFVFIDETGRVSACSHAVGELAISLSELRSADDWLSLPARFRAERAKRRPRACGDCKATRSFGKFSDRLLVSPSSC
jgi:radical SAM protein with 4Fe4S-binding SPASM domain